jgi:hypothetical protein
VEPVEEVLVVSVDASELSIVAKEDRNSAMKLSRV